VGAGNVLPAYLQALDRLVPRALAAEGPVCARRTETWPALRERRPGLAVVTRPEEVFEADDVDLVVILTPPASHPELVRAALTAGRHVLCEKPLARSAAEAAELFEQAERAGRHLVAAPFVHLNLTFRRLWTLLRDGALGRVHAARSHYGHGASTWAAWYHQEPTATLGDAAIYNLKSLAALLGPVVEVRAASAMAAPRLAIGGQEVEASDPDTWQLVLRHEGGALSSVLASHATVHYRRPGIELYGTEGTANLLGDDWDPQGIELWQEASARWEQLEPEDATWLWTDGLRDIVAAIRDGRSPLAEPLLDVHLHEVISAAAQAAASGTAVAVESRFPELGALRYEPPPPGHVHDRTRPPDEQ